MLQEWAAQLSRWWNEPAIYDSMVAVYTALPAIVTPTLFAIDAPYGRFAGKLVVDWSMNGKWGWCIMEAISPIMYSLSMWLVGPQTWGKSQILLTSMWLVHYANRAFIHPYRAPSMAPMHILTFLSSVVFNILNGYTNGVWVARHDLPITLRVACGAAIWTAGLVINIFHDSILFGLRKQKSDKQRYFIPRGSLFELVSCPNYFGEAIEWTGFALAAWPSTPAILFAVFTAANLFPRAYRSHHWYKKQFRDYPSSRRVVIPFVF